jgi:protein-tyrosine-phosphatase/DNA-binding transcriptional ArsR family regulator
MQYPAEVVIDSPPPELGLLADPRRWRLLRALAASDRRVGELCQLTGDPQNLVSYHLRCLRDAGLVSAKRSSFDGRDTYYRVELDRCGEALCQAGESLDPSLRLAAGAPVELRRTRRQTSVLFTCTGNSGRSQIAEALLQDLTDGRVRARSAGSHPKPLHPNAVRVLGERGIDISDRSSKHLDRFARTRFDHVITLCDKVREVCPEFPGQPTTAHWSTVDPSIGGDDRETLPAFQAVTTEIEARVRHLIARLAVHQEGHRYAR